MLRMPPVRGMVLASVSLVLCSLCPAEEAAPSAPDVPQLVAQLGAEEFADREAAEQALIRIGVPARPLLQAALDNDDPEVRHRSRKALVAIDQADLRARLEAFIGDVDGKMEHHLPAWEPFQKKYGSDKQVRQLFAEMHQGESKLLTTWEQTPERAAEVFQARSMELQQAAFGPFQRQVSLGSVAALLFVGSDPTLKLDDQASLPVVNLLNQAPFQQAIANGDRVAIARKLLGGWIQNRTESFAAYQNLHLAMRFDLKEGLAPALALIRGNADPSQVQFALLAVGKLGGKDNIADLQRSLKNTAVCSRFQMNEQMITTEVRDVALAVLLHVTGQDLKAYGYSRAQPNPQVLYNTHTLGFASTEERDAAFTKWTAYAKEQKLPEPPADEEEPAPKAP